MGTLIALEGLDGSGKRTLTERVVSDLAARGSRTATLAFPRYGRSVHADLAAEALRGEHGDLAASVSGMALLFALDRAGAKDELEKLLAEHDFVVLDRYVASNAAYSAARLGQTADGEIVSWTAELEYDRFGLPRPDLQILLDVPTELAAERALRRGRLDPGRGLDAYERDAELQLRTGAVYRELAERDWAGPWWRYRPDDDPATVTDRLAAVLRR
ncbi:dTMP kinase [Nocardia sp. NPDC057227]|uniref:dTMP kinase n=1 Tax=Nocardia sp. NPDC057227 TaxID=3346056 RepID=UPI0036333622